MDVVDPDDGKAVLNKIMADGTFDDLRQQVVAVLKRNAEFTEFVEGLVANSAALNGSRAEKSSQKEIFERLRKELEKEVMDKALTTVWSVLTSPEAPISRLIDQRVVEALHAVYAARQQHHQQ